MGAASSRSDRTTAVSRAAEASGGMRKPIVFLRFNPDGYTAPDGVEVRSCFYAARDRKGNTFPQAEPRRFARRMDALASRVVELAEKYESFPPEKEISVEHMFYCQEDCSCVHCSGSDAKRAATRPEKTAVYR